MLCILVYVAPAGTARVATNPLGPELDSVNISAIHAATRTSQSSFFPRGPGLTRCSGDLPLSAHVTLWGNTASDGPLFFGKQESIVRIFTFFVCAAAVAAAPVNILTQRGDNQRTAVNSAETQLNRQNVRAHFGKLWTLFSDSKIMAQPLYVSKLVVRAADAVSPKAKIQCATGCDVVIFGSMKGTVYAYLANEKPTSVNDTLIWAKYLGDPRNGGGDIDMWATDNPYWGILGTPVIDLANRLLYVVVWNQDQNYRLYALDLQSGSAKKGPVVIQGSIGGVAFFPSGKNNTQVHKQRAGLLLDHGLLYVSFGGDNSGMSGWMFVYDAQTLALKTVWSPVPKGPNGGIWMSGTGPLADAQGAIYLQTANGPLDKPHELLGDSLVKLNFTGTQIQVEDFFAPCDAGFLNDGNNDMDLGSAAPLFLPGDLVLGGGKSGAVYLMAKNNLGKFQPGAPLTSSPPLACRDSNLVLQRVQATPGHIHGTPVYWRGAAGEWVYVMGEGDNLKAFPFQNGRLKDKAADVKKSGWKPPEPSAGKCGGGLPDNWMPGGILTVSSNAGNDGIVWALVPANGDANSFRGVKGMLMAFNADNVSEELWRSQGANSVVDTADSFGLLSRFNSATVAGGKVFVANSGDKEPLVSYCASNGPTTFPANYGLVVYGLK